IAATIDRAIDAERFIGGDDGDMRRAEEPEVLQHLSGVARPVAARNAKRVVEQEAALAPALETDPAIFAREREIRDVPCPGASRLVVPVARPARGPAAGDEQMPWLAAAP